MSRLGLTETARQASVAVLSQMPTFVSNVVVVPDEWGVTSVGWQRH